jgi:hypothetical protein
MQKLSENFTKENEKYRNTLENQKESQDSDEAGMRFAYIVFRSMDAIESLEEEFS